MIDDIQQISPASLGVRATPTLILVNSAGMVTNSWVGQLSHDKAEEVVTALFDHWINDPEELPVSHFEEVENEGLARVVADYIAGMTDRFALEEHRKLFDPSEKG